MKTISSIVVVLLVTSGCQALDNGLALTPPMGWLSWARFTCNIDCDKYPNECINEQLYKDMADRLAADGYKDLGYEYVNIDDCWSEKERDPTTSQLVADKKRFPSGIKALAEYVHSKGLKLGLYNDMGTKTCAGYPGLWTGNKTLFEIDTKTFADWGIDSLKVDGCNQKDTKDFDWLFPEFGRQLNKTGRQILYSCEWPLYQYGQGIKPNYSAIADTCNLFRNFNDVSDSWDSVLSILDFYSKNQDEFVKYQKPGAYFDPDMLIVGDFGLSLDQQQVQFALWAMLGAPLYMSNDLRTISNESKAIVQNNDVILVSQDPLGIMAKLNRSENNIDVWIKPMNFGHFTVAYVNRNQLGSGVYVSYPLASLIPDGYPLKRYIGKNLYTKEGDIYEPTDSIELKVNPNGIQVIRLRPAQCEDGDDC